MTELLIILIGYLIGSIPTAYIIAKKFHNINIFESGSGNSGALNTFHSTRSYFSTLCVFILDFLKGAVGVFFLKYLGLDDFLLLGLYSISTISGHCFSVFIGFKGGRGLATALGSTLFYIPALPIIWVTIWIFSIIYKRKIHFANVSSSVILLALGFTNTEIIGNNFLSSPPETNNLIVSITTAIIFLIIIIKHIDVIKLNFNKVKENSNGN